MFFNRDLVLDCFTVHDHVYEYSKIQSGVKFYPEWWKNLASKNSNWVDDFHKYGDLTGRNTMKHCVGFTDLFKNSLVLPLWSDLRIAVGEQGTDFCRWAFSDGISDIAHHPQQTSGGAYPEDMYQHFKITSPWLFRCNDDIKWMFTEPTWHMLKDAPDVRVLPGMIDFLNMAESNINFFVKRKPEQIFIEMPVGSPLVMLTPMTERKIKLKTHLVTPQELKRIISRVASPPHISFGRNYSKIKRANRCKN